MPLVECSTCLVQGNIPAHGAYIKPPVTEYKSKPEAASPDQVVTDEKLEAWLAEGADLTQELSNAVLANAPDAHQVAGQARAPTSTPSIRKAMRRCIPRRANAIPS